MDQKFTQNAASSSSLEDSILNAVFDKDVSKFVQDEKQNFRIFTRAQKDICWKQAGIIKDRDPKRWRYDSFGNPVLYTLRGCHGALCHEYDHIIPFSKGGKTVVDNCQILQTSVNRYKGNKTDLSYQDLKQSSKPLKLTHEQMDLIEYAIYGNVSKVKEQEFANPQGF